MSSVRLIPSPVISNGHGTYFPPPIAIVGCGMGERVQIQAVLTEERLRAGRILRDWLKSYLNGRIWLRTPYWARFVRQPTG